MAARRPIDLFVFFARVGVFLFPSYLGLDWFVYPDQKWSMFAVRVAVSAFLVAALAAYARAGAAWRVRLTVASIVVATSSITVLCAMSGEGFSSPYNIGVLQVTVFSALFTSVPPRWYVLTMSALMTQHFVVLAFWPATVPAVLNNVFAIGFFGVFSMIVQAHITRLARENRALRGIVPICAHCKKIRDEAGEWREVASYISARSDAEFSHGLCPTCATEYYADDADPADPPRTTAPTEAGRRPVSP